MYGTGGHVSHSAMALRIDGELYIVESNTEIGELQGGVRKVPYEDWLNTYPHYSVVWLPLKPELSERSNSKMAIDAFERLEGLPYGFQNFLFSALDTETDNLPPLMASDMIPTLFSVLEMTRPDLSALLFTDALNKRLGTRNLPIAQIQKEAVSRGKSLQELMAEPEQDSWEYDGHPSIICSTLNILLFQAAGLLDGLTINASEFTPQDVYELDFYSTDRPAGCEEADPLLAYC